MIHHYNEETVTINWLMHVNSGSLRLVFLHVIYCRVTNYLKTY